ncbi:DgyrCDS6519 [Dimorphilus gyrociliatus]|uniref:DgyrCDS6519 n=1 Tax=Dimorphilus gyrociliatus TaxID=2664684 RepID=A0A7I8VPV3_9ANNE|nr:DgyrCDS6519 [Dimorphilus gyrociliatus]
MNLFDKVKDRLLNVKYELSASHLDLNSTKDRTFFSTGQKTINYNAGADLFERYHNDWEAIHKRTEESVRSAETIEKQINQVCDIVKLEYTAVDNLYTELNVLPELNEQLSASVDLAKSLCITLRSVEASLNKLENICEEEELMKNKQLHRQRLDSYKRKKYQQLERSKSMLATRHAKIVKEHEKRQMKVLKERQEEYGLAFEEQIRQYQQYGNAYETSLSGHQLTVDVGDICPEDDTEALNEFLASTEEQASTIVSEEKLESDDDT